MNLEQNLSWNAHLLTGDKSVPPAAWKQLGALKYVGRQILMRSRLLLVNRLFLSRIQYGIAIWGGTYCTNIKKMQ